MKLPRIHIYSLIFTLIIATVSAEEKKLKSRGTGNGEELKTLQINISPDLLKIDKALELKSKYKVAKEFAIKTEQNLKKKKKIKFRGSAGNIFKENASSVLMLFNTGNKKGEGASSGTGFLVDASGLIITNWHVTKGKKDILVWTLPNEGSIEQEFLFKNVDNYYGLVIAENEKEDLALIKVSGLPTSVKPIELGSYKDVEIGDTVYAIGHPIGYPWSFTKGTVSQIRENKKFIYDDKSEHLATVIQTQTPISPGNSGGPLFSESGKIVGVNSWGADGQNLNFAVAIDHAKEFIKANPNITKINPLNQLIKKEYKKVRTQDYNKNGVIDTWYIDSDNNGKLDLAFIDDNENGNIEGTLIDKNENGIYEMEIWDTDEDGKVDTAYFDEDEDGKAELKAYDYDQDGEWDKTEKLS